ncbi:TetR/AcrR family transcriptional repressor of mexJK operon [Bradyrhizobium diazoefficiens]|uniref:TetR/AcrR family transcriptional regulator n=1 Tax=Bradyrhizobium diazoefficiens TaxID=1355477 RepID=UPI0035173EC0
MNRLVFNDRLRMATISGSRAQISGRLPQKLEQLDRDRPAPDARVEHLLAAAKETFTSKGFAATTMDDIASAAGMSKRTLYKLFESKTDLFRAMLLRSLPHAHFRSAPLEGSPMIRLRDTLREAADIALSPGEIALQRLIIGERQASPALGRMFAEVILESGADHIAGLLKSARIEPRFEGVPLRRVAEMLLGMVFGHDHFRLLTDSEFKLNRRVLDKRIDLAISTFCIEEPPKQAWTTVVGGPSK